MQFTGQPLPDPMPDLRRITLIVFYRQQEIMQKMGIDMDSVEAE